MDAGKASLNDFQLLLDRLGGREPALAGAIPARLWRRCAETPNGPISTARSIFAAYAANEATDPGRSPKTQAGRAPFAPVLARISGELRTGLRVDDLRILRRRSAWLVHPDLMPLADRAQGEQIMAEVNAAIDQAIEEINASHR